MAFVVSSEASAVIRYIFVAFWAANVILFIFKRNHPVISSRALLPALFQAAGFFLEMMLVSEISMNGSSCSFYFFVTIFSLPAWGFPYFFRVALLTWYNYYANEEKSRFGNTFNKGESYFYRRKFLVSPLFQASLHLLSILLIIIAGIITFFASPSSSRPSGHLVHEELNSCLLSQGMGFIIVEFVAVFLMILFSAVKLWRVQDPFHLKLELRLALALSATAFPLYILAPLGVLPEYTSTVVVYSIFYVCMGISFTMPIIFSFVGKQIYVGQRLPFSPSERSLPSGFTDFKQVFDDPQLLASFKEYCVKKWCVENLLFMEEILAYKAGEESERIKRATEIKGQFLDDDAPLLVNLGGEIREAVLEKIARQECDQELFKEVEKEVEQFLYHGIFLPWASSRNAVAPPRDSRSLEMLAQK